MRIKAFLLSSVLLLSGCEQESQQRISPSTTKPTLYASGELFSRDSMTVSPPAIRGLWQMKVERLAPENKQVKKGDLLVKFDGQRLRVKLMDKMSDLKAARKSREQKLLENEAKNEQLKLDVAEAEMNFEKEKRKAEIVDGAMKEIERQKQHKQFAIAAENLDQAKQKLQQFQHSKKLQDELALSKIRRLEIKVDGYKRGIDKLSIRANKAGLVVYKSDHNGEKIAVGDTVNMGRKIMSIPSLDKLAVKAKFDERDTARVSVGGKVKVMIEAYPELPFTGVIDSLGQGYSNKSYSNPSVVFDVVVALDRIDPQLMRPGMQVKIELIEESSV